MYSVNRWAAVFSKQVSCPNGYHSLREKQSDTHYKSVVLLGGHRHNHEKHGGCSHDRIGVCCCHNKLLHSNDVQLGVFTPFRATLFYDKRHVVGIAGLMPATENERVIATAVDWAE